MANTLDRQALLDAVRQAYEGAVGGLPSKQQIFSDLDQRFPGWRDEPGLPDQVEDVMRAHTDTTAAKPGTSERPATAASSHTPDNMARPGQPTH